MMRKEKDVAGKENKRNKFTEVGMSPKEYALCGKVRSYLGWQKGVTV